LVSAAPRERVKGELLFRLGDAYCAKRQGERAADNLERAIAHCEAALTIFTRETFPLDWAAVQNNLAIAYGNRIRGELADNLEQAIAHLEAALTVRTREALPQDWAQTQNNLALAYSNRIRGERAGNLEQAIAHYAAALTVFIRDSRPTEASDKIVSVVCRAIEHVSRVLNLSRRSELDCPTPTVECLTSAQIFSTAIPSHPNNTGVSKVVLAVPNLVRVKQVPVIFTSTG
jgi:tetratricopeptide (TPR) repeat protein